jgi:predicted DNA-binding transcriptional regulator YafY
MVRMLVDGVVPAVAQPTPVELPEGKWYTMPELMARLGVPRGTLRRRLDKMRRMGAVEYRPGTGRAHPAQYRMRVVEGGKA